ncbi:MAG: prepilin-type N-terminal cleavage/methylation domain-containing protein [Cyanobacteriota bacterium]
MNKQNGISILEMLIALTLISILFFPMIDLLNRSFMVEYDNRQNVESKEAADLALNRMTNILKEASYIYDGTVNIPTEMGAYPVTNGENCIIALIPAYDSSGDIVQGAGETEFNAYAYALIPSYMMSTDYESGSNDQVFVESFNTFYCQSDTDDPRKPTSTCEDDWTGTGSTNIIFEGAKPGNFGSAYTSSLEPVSANKIEVAFAAKDGKKYYHSAEEGPSIDEKNIQSTDIFLRNVPN